MSVYVLKDNYGDSIAGVRLAWINTIGFHEWAGDYGVLINGERIAIYNTIGQAKAAVKEIIDALISYHEDLND